MKTIIQELIEEFNNMSKEAMFEIEHMGEYYIYYVQANESGLEAGGCSNTGFSSMGIDIVEWDDCFSLDEHIQSLYEICLEDAQSNDTRQEISEDELITMYDDMLNECHEEVFNIQPARILSECDPIAYQCGLSDYYDSLEDHYCEAME